MILSPALKECATDLLTFASVLIAQVIRGLSTEGSFQGKCKYLNLERFAVSRRRNHNLLYFSRNYNCTNGPRQFFQLLGTSFFIKFELVKYFLNDIAVILVENFICLPNSHLFSLVFTLLLESLFPLRRSVIEYSPFFNA